MGKYDGMSLEKLEKEKLKLHNKREELRLEAKEIQEVQNKRSVEEKAKRTVKGMSDEEKKEVQRILEAGGIESEEGVGTPGTG